jgi:hypothetical protein
MSDEEKPKKDKPSNFIPTFENGGYWEYYQDLERQFENFLEFVPYLAGNEKTYSFRLANLLYAIGAHIDSAFKEVARYPEFSTKYPEILGKRKPSIVDYFPLAEEYKLFQRKVMFKCLPEREQVMPFQQFVKVGNEVKTPSWWQIYNGVKHHFSEEFHKANLRNTRNSLAGAFLLNILHVPAYLRLIECRVVKPSQVGVGHYSLNEGWQEKMKELVEKEQWFGFIETSLFSYDYQEQRILPLGKTPPITYLGNS